MPVHQLHPVATALPGDGLRDDGGRLPLDAVLLRMGAADQTTLDGARARQTRLGVSLDDVLRANGDVDDATLCDAMAARHGAGRLAGLDPLRRAATDPRYLPGDLVARIGAERCIAAGLVPVRRVGAATVVACARPDDWVNDRTWVEAAIGPARMVVATRDEVADAVVAARGVDLVTRAEGRVAAPMSCRGIAAVRPATPVAAAAVLAAAAFAAPMALFSVLTVAALLTLVCNAGLQMAMIAVALRHRPASLPRHDLDDITRQPVVSILVPLHAEREIARTLVRRLERLRYPRELLDVCLVIEAGDALTRATLAATDLPPWMRVVAVPAGAVTTKPRAMNYALDFCRGSIVGIYDAEDAPEPDQIARMVRQFAAAPAEVACLQGRLDFYNARSNWMSRCFALEYVTWFRLVLPGLRRLGMAVPLGGTTVFFRRDALEALGAWDAHNVTEDADLGIRLARAGFVTDLLDSTTYEEATATPWRWVRQRSRWLKGYAFTWAVHMRDPAALWRDLGPRGFLGFQLLFLGALAGFGLAPFLWAFWLLMLGGVHPWSGEIPHWAGLAVTGILMTGGVTGIAATLVALRGAPVRGLAPWALTMQAYFPLATLALAKALAEMALRPFFWDKTAHGLSPPDEACGDDTTPSQEDGPRRAVGPRTVQPASSAARIASPMPAVLTAVPPSGPIRSAVRTPSASTV